MGKSKSKAPDPYHGVGDPSRWLEFGIRDQGLFAKLCDRYKFKAPDLSAKVKELQHRHTDRQTRTMERQTVIEMRTKGHDGVHMIIKSQKDGIWYCQCPAYIYKGGMKNMIPCKHLVYCIVNGLGTAEDWFQYLV